MSVMSIAVTLHVIAVVLWVGGMFFAHQCLRPVAASQLEPAQRLPLWVGVFGRFFPWVWVSVVVVLATGLWMILGHFGGFGAVRPFVHTMFLLGIVMMLIFMHVYFAPYKKLKRAVGAQDWPAGAKSLNQIRMLVGINTVIGVITIAVGSAGRYFA
ncbi:MAG: CopD family protein [Gammaproteobacteria bacterium]